MSNVPRFPWLRLAAEGAAIVTSILVAFWIDAWWEDRNERILEATLLEALHQELREAQVKFEENDIHVSAIRQSAIDLLKASASSDSMLRDEEIDSLLWDLSWYVDSTFLDLPILQNAISEGEIALISSNSLRRDLGVWLVKVNTVKASIEDDLEYYKQRQEPYLEKHSSSLQIANATARKPGFPEQNYPGSWPEASHVVSHRELIKNRQFQNILIRRISTLTNIVEWRDPEVVVRLHRLIELVEDELAELQ